MLREIQSRSRAFVNNARTGLWLNSHRVRAYATIMLAFELLAMIFLIAGTHGWIVPLGHPNTTDFVSFYAAGKLANDGVPADAYIQALHLAAEEQVSTPGISYVYFFYPPTFLILCALLARLPYLIAFLTFEFGTLTTFALVVRRILNQPISVMLLPLLAFPAVFINIGVGQNAFLTAAIMGGATLLVDRKPFIAGLLFGALVYKPHFGLLIPLALIANANWKAFAGAALSAISLACLAGILFGLPTWEAFFKALVSSHQTYEEGRVDFAAFVSPFGAIRLLGMSSTGAYLIQGIATVTAALLVIRTWRSCDSLPLRAATLISATLVAVPLSLFYDLCLSAVAVAWLIRERRLEGVAPWENLVFGAVFLAPLMTRSVGTSLHIPLALPIMLALLGVCFARVRRARIRKSRYDDSASWRPPTLVESG